MDECGFWIYKIFAKTADILQELGFFEFFGNYIKDFRKIDQTRLKKNEIILEIYYVFVRVYRGIELARK